VTRRPNRFGSRWLFRAPAAVLAVTALLVGAAPAAEAHNILVGTSPTDGSMTAVVPGQVTLTFNEPAVAVGTILIVTGPAGQVQTGAAVLVNNTVTEQLRPGSPAGRYTVAWRVTSADGHPVSGKFSFTAMAPSPNQQVSATTATTTTPAGTAKTTGTANKANPGGHSSTVWWVGVGGVVALLLLMGFVAARKPRSTPQDERDPES
jgi:methionine-rich copper-binding protein CopC